MKNYKFIISGKVQGVYYRVSIKNNALKSNYNGYVRNLSDGTVEAAITCEESQLDNFIGILKQGSKHSDVTHIKQSECDEVFTNTFIVK